MDRLDVKRIQILDALEEVLHSQGAGELTVGKIMTPIPHTIRQETSVLEVVQLLHAKEFRHLLVTDETGKLVGVISDRDVIRCFGPGHPDKQLLNVMSAYEIMSTDLITVGPETLLDRAVIIMVDHGISCLPVMADDALVGILTNTDLHVVLHLLVQSLPTSLPLRPAPAEAARRFV